MLVYKITNTVNGKVYIGCTSQSLRRRWVGHIDRAKYGKWKSQLHLDILEYGTRNFTTEVLQECSAQEAEMLEQRYIETLNSYHPTGYNIRSGGSTSPMALSSRQKLKGRVFTLEHRQNISKSRKGRPNPYAKLTIQFAQQARWKTGKPVGEKNPHARLSAEKVLEIRQRYKEGGVSQDKLAIEYGIKQITVSAIVRGKIWRHLPT